MTDFPGSTDTTAAPLADEVARLPGGAFAALDWVGMQHIEMPVRLALHGETLLMPARVGAFVDLRDQDARGIHMSRLYRLCDEHLTGAPLDAMVIERLLAAFLASHADLSQRARLQLRLELPLRRPALLSGLSGWRQYPVTLDATLGPDGLRCSFGVEVLYSSTCPGSAAMARQVVQQRFLETFAKGAIDAQTVADWLASPQGGTATPHAQRSQASIRVLPVAGLQGALPLEELIDHIEGALATPVQAAVKRIDEQEFARLNGENPMYCEDAARRIRAVLEAVPWVADYAIRAAHLESLHPHDAVAQVVKGVPGGFVPA